MNETTEIELTAEEQEAMQKKRSISKQGRVIIAKTLNNGDSVLSCICQSVLIGGAISFCLAMQNLWSAVSLLYFFGFFGCVVLFLFILGIKQKFPAGHISGKIRKHKSQFKSGDFASITGHFIFFLSCCLFYYNLVLMGIILLFVSGYLHYIKSALEKGKISKWAEMPENDMIQVASRSLKWRAKD